MELYTIHSTWELSDLQTFFRDILGYTPPMRINHIRTPDDQYMETDQTLVGLTAADVNKISDNILITPFETEMSTPSPGCGWGIYIRTIPEVPTFDTQLQAKIKTFIDAGLLERNQLGDYRLHRVGVSPPHDNILTFHRDVPNHIRSLIYHLLDQSQYVDALGEKYVGRVVWCPTNLLNLCPTTPGVALKPKGYGYGTSLQPLRAAPDVFST